MKTYIIQEQRSGKFYVIDERKDWDARLFSFDNGIRWSRSVNIAFADAETRQSLWEVDPLDFEKLKIPVHVEDLARR